MAKQPGPTPWACGHRHSLDLRLYYRLAIGAAHGGGKGGPPHGRRHHPLAAAPVAMAGARTGIRSGADRPLQAAPDHTLVSLRFRLRPRRLAVGRVADVTRTRHRRAPAPPLVRAGSAAAAPG